MRRSTTGVMGAIAALAVLLVAGCASSVAGQGQAATTLSTSTSETTESTETAESTEETTETTESSETTDDTETTTDASAAELDDQSVYFFQTFCTGATALQEYVMSDLTGLTPEELQATAIEGYTNLATSAAETVSLLGLSGPPTFENGQELYDNAVERFSVFAEVYAAGAATIQALIAPTEEELRAAISATEEVVKSRLPGTVDLPDTAVQEAVRQIPECAPVF